MSKKLSEEQRRKMSESAKKRECKIQKGMQERKPHYFIDGVEFKECAKCKTIKELDSFWKEKRRWDGLGSKCKDCANTAAKKRYHNNVGFAAKDKKFAINRRREIKKQCIEYLGNKCGRCDLEHEYLKNTAIFQFHHRYPEEKDFAIASVGHRKFEKLKNELDKCLLLCANCHNLVHWQIDGSDDEL